MATRPRKGHTLMEVLVTGAILGLFMTMVCHALVVAYRTYTVTAKKSTDFRQGTVAIDRMTRELRMADKFYDPDPAASPWSTFGAYTPKVGTSAPMIFRTYDKTGPRVVGYTWDQTNKNMQRLLYDPAFDPGNAATQNVLETKKVCFEVTDLRIERLDPTLTSGVPFLHLEMNLTNITDPIQTEVRVKSL